MPFKVTIVKRSKKVKINVCRKIKKLQIKVPFNKLFPKKYPVNNLFPKKGSSQYPLFKNNVQVKNFFLRDSLWPMRREDTWISINQSKARIESNYALSWGGSERCYLIRLCLPKNTEFCSRSGYFDPCHIQYTFALLHFHCFKNVIWLEKNQNYIPLETTWNHIKPLETNSNHLKPVKTTYIVTFVLLYRKKPFQIEYDLIPNRC